MKADAGITRIRLAVESHPKCDHHYVFAPDCLDRFAEQAVGLSVSIDFEGDPVGTVVGATRTVDSVLLDIEFRDLLAAPIETRSPSPLAVAGPAFVVTEDEWNADYTERVIWSADLKGIGLTDD